MSNATIADLKINDPIVINGLQGKVTMFRLSIVGASKGNALVGIEYENGNSVVITFKNAKSLTLAKAAEVAA